MVAAQILLNRKLREGTYIKVDGIFGLRTHGAVVAFQREHHLKQDGVIGQFTWKKLTSAEGIAVIDAVDVTNPKDMGYEDAAIRDSGGQPIVNFGMCNGVRVVIDQIRAGSGQGNVVLLRFHGHGAPGFMGLTVGTDAHASSEFGVRFLDSLAAFLRTLSPIFAEYGSAELHGCRVGAGPDGRRLVTALAHSFNVPVTAGLRTQYGGGSSTFRFEGPVFTAFPRGGDMQDWVRSLSAPEIWGMSVSRR